MFLTLSRPITACLGSWGGSALVWLLAALALLAMAPAAAQDDALMRTTLFMDPSGQLGVDDMAAQTFMPVANPFSKGHTAAVAWVKLEVAPNAAPELVLLVRIANLDTVQLFSPSGQAPGWRVQQTGDQVAFNARPRPEVNFSLTLTPDATRTSVHYLRVTATMAMVVSTKLLTPAQSQSFDVFIHGFMGVYMGVIVLLLWLAVVRWWITRDVLWGLCAVFQVSTVLYIPAIMGFVSKYILPDSPALADVAVNVLGCLNFFAAGLFFLVLYRAYRAPWLAQLVYWLSMALFPVLLVMLAMGHARQAMSLNANFVLLQTFWGMGAVWFLRIDDLLLRRLLRGTYIALTLYVLYYMLPLLGLAINTELTIYPGLLTGIFISVMQHLVLVRRTQLQVREQQQLSQHMLEMDKKLNWETARRAETNSFMSMLIHEIKNPLASIRLATQSLVSGRASEAADRARRLKNIEKSVQGIDTVLERCIETDRMEQGALTIVKQSHDVARLVSDWVAAEPQAGRIALHLPTELHAQVDAPLLGLMLRNLLSNALAYSPEASVVQVTLLDCLECLECPECPGVPQPALAIQVRNAVGRAGKPDAARIFEKYYRAPAAHHSTGTGLGLYWVHGVAHMMGGRISYLAPDDNVVMTLCLPC